MTALLIGLFVFSMAFLGHAESRLQRINKYLVMRNQRERSKATRHAAPGRNASLREGTLREQYRDDVA